MKKVFSVTQAKCRFHRIVREVEAGSTVALKRRGKPVAILAPIGRLDRGPRRKRRIDWGSVEIDTLAFRFDREEDNAR
jgi:antitoxin (DNA-binding transcriptional repressor) of toxin-antitoxin stability system